jgi:Predicted peptidase
LYSLGSRPIGTSKATTPSPIGSIAPKKPEFGTALQRQPKRFAAAIAICGGGDPAYAEAMKDLPIYIFHGMQDGIVMPPRSIQMYDALREAGSQKGHPNHLP